MNLPRLSDEELPALPEPQFWRDPETGDVSHMVPVRPTYEACFYEADIHAAQRQCAEAQRLNDEQWMREQKPVAEVFPCESTVRLQWASVEAAHNAKPGPLFAAPVPGITVDALSPMVEPLNGLDRNAPGYHRACGWNDALRRAMDYAAPVPASQGDEEVLRDAERYRKLRRALSDRSSNGKSHWICSIAEGQPEELDAAVDALATQQAVQGEPAYFLAARLRRVAKLAGVELPDEPDAETAALAGVYLGMVARALARAVTPPAPQQPEALAQQERDREDDIEAAAKKLAEVMDYPWEHMPDKGRAAMRGHAEAVIRAARSSGGGGKP